MVEEFLDIYDEEMNHIGTAPRSEVHQKGLWHKSFHCWIVKDGKVWLQLRAHDKDNHPNLLDISAAGHLSAGESEFDGIREIEEELGIPVSIEECVFVFNKTQNGTERPGYINREFNPTYFLNTKHSLSDLKMQKGEVDGVFEISPDDAIDLFTFKVDELVLEGVYRETGKAQKKVTLKDFVNHGNEYYIEIFSIAKKMFPIG